jgi:hypothetical protein
MRHKFDTTSILTRLCSYYQGIDSSNPKVWYLWWMKGQHDIVQESTFRWACDGGNLAVVRWLWNLDPHNRPNHKIWYDTPFCLACKNGQLTIARWLWNLDPTNRPDPTKAKGTPLEKYFRD